MGESEEVLEDDGVGDSSYKFSYLVEKGSSSWWAALANLMATRVHQHNDTE